MPGTERVEEKALMLIDVKKAHVNGVVGEDEYAYIELPGEAGKSGTCGRLKGSTACDKLQVRGKGTTPLSWKLRDSRKV